MSERVDVTALVPQLPGEDDLVWTGRLLAASREAGTFRQCSIGWHEECSQQQAGPDSECNCLCHADEAEVYSVEGDAEGGTITVLRSEAGKHSWPPQPNEPATMWAVWILGTSADDASKRALARQKLVAGG